MKGASLPIAFAVLVVGAVPAEASFPGSNGPIAAEQSIPGGAVIGSINADGTGARGLVAVGPADRDASWSPDGRRLAFTSTRDGNEEVYVLDVETGAQTRLTFDPASDHDPAFSPDGTSIAFASNRAGSSDIYRMPTAGGPATQLTSDPGDDRQPAWSPSDQIAFASDRSGDFELYVMDSQGQNTRQLTQDPGADLDPSWGPLSSRLAYAHETSGDDRDVYAIDADGQNRRPLLTGPRDDHLPAWSPDGTRIAFTEGFGPSSQILVMPADGAVSGLPAQPVGSGMDPSWAPLPPPVGGPASGATVILAATNARVLVAPATTQAPSTDPVLQAQLRSTVELPVGTTIDATAGTVAIDAVTTTPEGPGNVGHATVNGGVFTITQGAGAGAEPTLVLRTRTCAQVAAARLAAPDATMHIRARGRFRTVAGYGRGAGRGTEWIMRDRCDGTSFRVLEGVVLVRDFRRRKTFAVRAGRCYLAASTRRRDALKPARRCPPVRAPR